MKTSEQTQPLKMQFKFYFTNSSWGLQIKCESEHFTDLSSTEDRHFQVIQNGVNVILN